MEHTRQTESIHRSRTVEQLVAGRATSDGAGVKLTRVLTHEPQQRLDPFLMLDAFGSDDAADYIAGFPDHPHRGFETVTYMIAGRMRHRDSAGHEGLLENGGVQWMTAGRVAIHSEIPEQEAGRMEGRVLAEPAGARQDERAVVPRFRRRRPAPVHHRCGGRRDGDRRGKPRRGGDVRESTAPLYLDIHLPPGGRFAQPLPAGHNAFLYVYRGGERGRHGGSPRSAWPSWPTIRRPMAC